MSNPEILPYPEPSEQEVAGLTEAFLVLNRRAEGYTEALARKDACKILEFVNATKSGFLAGSDEVVELHGGIFSPGTPETSE